MEIGLYTFAGQAVSLSGTWMQQIAQSWLVLTLTRSSVDVGAVGAAQALPVLVLGPYGGVVADRVDKRRLMVVLQSLMGVQALALGLLTLLGAIRFWQIALPLLMMGLVVTLAYEFPVSPPPSARSPSDAAPCDARASGSGRPTSDAGGRRGLRAAREAATLMPCTDSRR